MARTCKNEQVHTLSNRRGLAPRQAPYWRDWRAVRQGLHVGYRKKALGSTAGT
ncbi:hypothetical protein GCM10010964_28420 [Caldovatus sediminis]|uniref:Uncharacterized protein n=1 Tax=Caldovatus sediminis TaxID=2041189 RepID=A0A8J3EEC4_9PROT|nr:hypothetical protein GCM10010964_28420 [Caldovatus sediminis]